MKKKSGLKDVWLWVFIVPTLISFMFFAVLTVDSLKKIPKRTNEHNLTSEVIAGKRVFEKYNCNNCHTFFGIGGYYAPDLTKIYKKYGDSGRELLKNIIVNPENYFGKESKNIFDFGRRMQKPHIKKIKFVSEYNPYFTVIREYITAEEAERIIDYLKWASEVDNNDWPPVYSEKNKKDADGEGDENGMLLLESKNCLICHKYNDRGGDVGPELSEIKKKFESSGDLKNFIANPKIRSEETLMPPYGGAEFTTEELDKLTMFLWEDK